MARKPPGHRRVARGEPRSSRRQASAGATFDLLNLWYFGDIARRQQPELAPEERLARLRRGGRRPVRGGGRYEARPVPVLRQLLRVRRLPRCLPGGCCDQARPGHPLPVRLRPVHRLRRLLRAVPGPRDRDDPGDGCPIRRRAGLPGRTRDATSTATRRRPRSPTGATRCAASTRSPRPRRWPSWPTSGRARGGRTSGATSPRWWRCRARAAPPARCTARCRAGRSRRRSRRRRACC